MTGRAAERAEALRRVEAEVRRAKAEALGRLGERLDDLLAELAALDRRLDARLAALPSAPASPRALAADVEVRNRLRDRAQELVQHLIIQREAIGLVRHAAVAEHYRVPPRRPDPFRTDLAHMSTPIKS